MRSWFVHETSIKTDVKSTPFRWVWSCSRTITPNSIFKKVLISALVSAVAYQFLFTKSYILFE
ncbi:hypothetical protein OUZ56_016721 [Daphnia magna]|uniref:Uncharacterized protein n=1 Tax=Daphnia magna TaxID=35525 RepID=A0ABR0ARD4_9CRUS|nr:hypothetical protein OUZ56_016721 [Daphnia magna]